MRGGIFLTMKQGSTTGLTRAVSIPSSLLWVGKSSQTDKESTIGCTVGTGRGGSIFLPTCGTGRWCEASGQVLTPTCMKPCACCSTPPSFCATVRCCINPMGLGITSQGVFGQPPQLPMSQLMKLTTLSLHANCATATVTLFARIVICIFASDAMISILANMALLRP